MNFFTTLFLDLSLISDLKIRCVKRDLKIRNENFSLPLLSSENVGYGSAGDGILRQII